MNNTKEIVNVIVIVIVMGKGTTEITEGETGIEMVVLEAEETEALPDLTEVSGIIDNLRRGNVFNNR